MSFSQGLGNAYFELDQNVKATLVVYDLNGRKMESISLKTNRLELAPQQFAPGIYIVQITTAKGISTFKLSRN
jgi:RNA 3'-terminal phosphate cyclase